MIQIICLKCKSKFIEQIQPDEFVCKSCWTYFKASKVTDQEKIDWFANE